jgi:SanA protein
MGAARGGDQVLRARGGAREGRGGCAAFSQDRRRSWHTRDQARDEMSAEQASEKSDPGMRRRRRRPWKRVLRAVAAAGLAVVLAGAGFNALVTVSARPHLFEDVARVPSRTVAIVPGARVYPGGVPSPALEDRLEAARALYARGAVRRILASGDHEHDDYDEVTVMYSWLVAHGVAPADVFLDHAGLRTLDTMERARRVFQVRDAVVCTQRFHLARAVFLARRAGIDAVGLVADRRAYVHARSDRLREVVARGVAVVDSYVLRTAPRYLGPAIPIGGDATATHGPRSAL